MWLGVFGTLWFDQYICYMRPYNVTWDASAFDA